MTLDGQTRSLERSRARELGASLAHSFFERGAAEIIAMADAAMADAAESRV
jgi:hypothetical protein